MDGGWPVAKLDADWWVLIASHSYSFARYYFVAILVMTKFSVNAD
jgi:hypothetical protein